MASGEAAQVIMQASPVVAPPMLGTAARRVNAVEHVAQGRLCWDSNSKDTGAKSPHVQSPPQPHGRLRQQRRTPTTPRCPPHDAVERKHKEWTPRDVCRTLFSEVGYEVEQGLDGEQKQTRCQGADFDDEREECMDARSTERSGGAFKSQKKGGDSPMRLCRRVSEERSVRISETTKLLNNIKELRAQISASVHDAMEAAEARLAAQVLTAIAPRYDDLRQRVGAIESQILGVPDSLSAKTHEGRESRNQLAEHLPPVWPERLGERIAALEERSEGISALERAVADLRLPLVALESKRETELQMTARSEPVCEVLRDRVSALELHCATVICSRPVSDVQEAINSSERRLMSELQAVRAESTERVQVLSSQLLEVYVAALQAQALEDGPSPTDSVS